MTEKEQIERNAKTIREVNASIISLGNTAGDLGESFKALGENLRIWRLNRIPKEQVEQYKTEVMDYAKQIGFDTTEIAEKLTDRVLRQNILNHSDPVTAITFCLV